MAEPTFVDFDRQAGGNGTSIVFSWTNIIGEAANDYAFACLYKESTATLTAPGGIWSLLTTWDQSTGGFKYRAAVYVARLVGGESGTITWSWTGNTYRAGIMGVFRNLISTEDPASNYASDTESAQNDQPSHPGITVTRSSSGLLFVTWNFNATPSTPPTGYTEVDDVSRELQLNYDVTSISTGATGTVASSLTDAEYASSILLEMATVAAATGLPPGLGPALAMQPGQQSLAGVY